MEIPLKNPYISGKGTFLYFRKQKPPNNYLYFRKLNFVLFQKTGTLKSPTF